MDTELSVHHGSTTDRIVDSGGHNKGEEARVEVPPTSREAIMICTWIKEGCWRKWGSVRRDFKSPCVRFFICMHNIVNIYVCMECWNISLNESEQKISGVTIFVICPDRLCAPVSRGDS